MKDNTTEFTPTGDYQPATKKYVDENSGSGAVRYDAAQTLTDAQQTQARKNILAQEKLYTLELDTPIVENITLGDDQSETSSYTFPSSLTLTNGDSYLIDILCATPIGSFSCQLIAPVSDSKVQWDNGEITLTSTSLFNAGQQSYDIIKLAKVVSFIRNSNASLVTLEGVGGEASGFLSHVEGYGTQATGWSSHAEGNETKAVGSASHTEGEWTNAQAPGSHAEGSGTHALGYGSHAEGQSDDQIGDITLLTPDTVVLDDWEKSLYVLAKGDASHAEGHNCLALGPSSHAEGLKTAAVGSNSHSEGNLTQAHGENQHVQGKCNIIDDTIYAHIVGNGESDSARSNAHTLDWSGNAWFAGDVYVGSTSGTNKDDGSKKLATEAFVNDKIHISTADPTASDGNDGDIWLKYEA